MKKGTVEDGDRVAMKLCLFLTFIFSLTVFASENKKVAKIKMMRGKAEVVTPDKKKVAAKKGLWILEGSKVITQAKSFVRLLFTDKSTINVGPSSEMQVEKFSKDEPGVINVISGKIRSKVTKDYLDRDRDKSKMYVKSKSAVMGIRGTDFIFSANKRTGAATAVLFEGSVVFSKINPGEKVNNLEAVVNRGQKINPGQFSVVKANLKKPTVPAKMSTNQFKALESNESFKDSGETKTAKKVTKSIVPPGLTGDVIQSDIGKIEESVEKSFKVDVDLQKEAKEVDADSKGFVRNGELKPVDGSIVHIESGNLMPMGVDSTFDAAKDEWVSQSFSADATGNIQVPEGYELTDEGQLLKVAADGAVKEVRIEIAPLDIVPPLDQMETQEYKEASRLPASDDPGGLNPIGPVPEEEFETPDLIPTGEDWFVPPARSLDYNPEDKKSNSPSTRVKFNVIKN